VTGGTGTCIVGFRTTTDFYFTGGLFNSAKPKDPKNFRLQVSIPDADAAIAAPTDTFSVVAGFGDPAANVAYSIDTVATGDARLGSGTATLDINPAGASLTFTGQAPRVGDPGSADIARIDGALRCTTVLHPRG
jgi:hypothetical protein